MFVFFDTETTGTNIDFDQIIQFAAVLTDSEFKILDSLNIRCQRLPWVIPSPGAMTVTKTLPSQLNDSSLPSLFEMMATIRSVLERWSPAVFIGYNSMPFDEPLLQRAFWQSLCPPYLTVTKGNSRLDLLPILRGIAALADSPIKVPRNQLGKQTFKLDILAPLNGFDHSSAHDALADVYATIHLAKAVAHHHSDVWASICSRTKKAEISNVIASNELLNLSGGTGDGRSSWWTSIDPGREEGQAYATVLRADVDWITIGRAEENHVLRTFSASPRPIRRIALNKSPFFLTESEASRFLGLSAPQQTVDRTKELRADAELSKRLLSLYNGSLPTYSASPHLEQQIFDGFPSAADAQLMEKFQRTPANRRVDFISQFQDRRLQQLAQRIVFVTARSTLPQAQIDRMLTAISRRVTVEQEDQKLWRTIPEALRQLTSADAERAPPNFKNEIETWLVSTLEYHSKYNE